MTPHIFEQLMEIVRREPQPLARLHAFAADAGSAWTPAQLHLMLAALDGIELEEKEPRNPLVRLGRQSPQEELADVVAEAVRLQGGGPLPAPLVLRLLGHRFTTSLEQIKKIARETPGLKLVGPGLIALDKQN